MLRNARALQDRTGSLLIPMVKANAYGVGIGVVETLESLDPVGLRCGDRGRRDRAARTSLRTTDV